MNGWDYEALLNAYMEAGALARASHVPVMIHVLEMTQPQGHSTSGSHERYKNAERLKWEKDWDCISKFREYILSNKIANADTLDKIESEAKVQVKKEKEAAWNKFSSGIKQELNEAVSLLRAAAQHSTRKVLINQLAEELYIAIQNGAC